MSIYTFYYTKVNAFMNYKGKTSQLNTYSKDGEEVLNNKTNKKQNVPGAFNVYTPRRKGSKILIDIDQKELNELVKELYWYDDNDKQIMEAPIANAGAPFWRHPNCYKHISLDGFSLNDEEPEDRFWLAVFRADNYFIFKDDSTHKIAPSILKRARFTAQRLGTHISEGVDRAMEGIKANKRLDGLADAKKVMILRAMGTNIEEYKGTDKERLDAFNKTVTATLYGKITDFKDEISEGERQIDKFMRLSQDESGEAQLAAHINHAKQLHIIKRDRSNRWKFGQVILGTSLAQVKEFLNDDSNDVIFQEILKKIGDA